MKLGQKITDRIGHKVTADDPEYWGLACVVTDEMAEVALKMKVRKPMTLAQLVKATGKDAESLEKLLYEMSVIGILEYNWENPAHEKAICAADVCAGQRGVYQYEPPAASKAPGIGALF